MLNIADYKFGKIIARTERSSVILASNKITSQKVALKCYRVHSRSSPEYLHILNEFIILSKCNHPNIVKFHGFAEETYKDEVLNEDFLAIYLVMEPLESNIKEIFKKNSKNGTFLSLQELKRVIRDLFPVFNYLERELIVHQDIKPANIMINDEGKYKLVDVWTGKNLFGRNTNATCFPVEGTLAYSSPEKIEALLKNQGIFQGNMFKSDVFSFGLVLLQLATMKKIKGLNTGDEQAKSLLNIRISEAEERYNKTLGSLLRVLLEHDPNKRKTFLEINEESFFEIFADEGGISAAVPFLNRGTTSNNSPLFPTFKENMDSKLKKKGSFHSVTSSELQAIFQPMDTLGTSQIDNNSQEIENLLRDAEKYRKICNYNKALELFEKCFKLKWQNPKPEEDLQTSMILSGLGHVCLEIGNYHKGEELHDKALKIRRRLLGEVHKLTAESYNSLGVAFHGQGVYDKALENFERAMELYEKLFGLDNKSTALAYNNVAGVYCLLGKHEKALDLRKLSLEIRLKINGERSEEAASGYDSIANELSDLNKTEESLKNRLKALEIRRGVFGDRHGQTSLSLAALAMDYLQQKNYEKCLENGLEALEIRMEIYGKNHVETARSFQTVGEGYWGVGNMEKGAENLEKAYNIRKNLLGEDNEETAKSKRDWEEINIKMKLYN